MGKDLNTLDFKKELIHKENNPESQAHFEANKDKFSNQCRIIYEALLNGKILTTKIAVVEYDIMDLRRRIKDLKDTWGVPIKSRYVDGRFKEFYL